MFKFFGFTSVSTNPVNPVPVPTPTPVTEKTLRPVQCKNNEETLRYIVTLPQTPKYHFNVKDYLSGDLLLKNVSAPFYIFESETKRRSRKIDRHGDILWKLVITGLDLQGNTVQVNVGEHLVYEETLKTGSPIHCFEIDLFNGKGVPLLSSYKQEITLKISESTGNGSKGTVPEVCKVYQYLMNLDHRERQALCDTPFTWPGEGSFASGIFSGCKVVI